MLAVVLYLDCSSPLPDLSIVRLSCSLQILGSACSMRGFPAHSQAQSLPFSAPSLGIVQVHLPLQERATPMLKIQQSLCAILEQADHKKQVLQWSTHLPHYVTPDERGVFVGCCNRSGQAIVHQGHLHPLVMRLQLLFDGHIPQLKCCADLVYA